MIRLLRIININCMAKTKKTRKTPAKKKVVKKIETKKPVVKKKTAAKKTKPKDIVPRIPESYFFPEKWADINELINYCRQFKMWRAYASYIAYAKQLFPRQAASLEITKEEWVDIKRYLPRYIKEKDWYWYTHLLFVIRLLDPTEFAKIKIDKATWSAIHRDLAAKYKKGDSWGAYSRVAFCIKYVSEEEFVKIKFDQRVFAGLRDLITYHGDRSNVLDFVGLATFIKALYPKKYASLQLNKKTWEGVAMDLGYYRDDYLFQSLQKISGLWRVFPEKTNDIIFTEYDHRRFIKQVNEFEKAEYYASCTDLISRLVDYAPSTYEGIFNPGDYIWMSVMDELKEYRDNKNWFMFASKALSIKKAYPWLAYSLNINQAAWDGMTEVLKETKRNKDWYGFVLQASRMLHLCPERTMELPLDDKNWEKLVEFYKQMYDDHYDWIDIPEFLRAMKDLFPGRMEELKLNDKIWADLKEDVDAYFKIYTYDYMEVFFYLQLLEANKIKIDDNGLKVVSKKGAVFPANKFFKI